MYSLKNEKGGESMTEAEKQILRKFPHKTISLGVTEDGHKRSIPVPWQMGCNAYNMRTPDLWLSPAELSDEDLWAELARLRVTGMYIFCPLEDYSFLSRLTAIQDLAIYKGGALRDLRFLRQMPDWFWKTSVTSSPPVSAREWAAARCACRAAPWRIPPCRRARGCRSC